MSKPIFKSKTVLAASLTAIAGALGSFSPVANQFLAANASLILLGLGLLNIALRMATKGRVLLFADAAA